MLAAWIGLTAPQSYGVYCCFILRRWHNALRSYVYTWKWKAYFTIRCTTDPEMFSLLLEHTIAWGLSQWKHHLHMEVLSLNWFQCIGFEKKFTAEKSFKIFDWIRKTSINIANNFQSMNAVLMKIVNCHSFPLIDRLMQTWNINFTQQVKNFPPNGSSLG